MTADSTAPVEDILLDRLAVSPLSDRAKDLVVAALLGQHELEAALGGTAPSPPPRASATDRQTEPIGTYLTEIEVTGFRGIGPAAKLSLEPGPGLTIVTGRNGSGKSSFAEAAELALTGAIQRLHDKAAVWKEGWRNLHFTGEPTVRVRLLVDGQRGGATLECRWPAGTDFDHREAFLQIQGRPRGSIEDLGWGQSLQLYRPFLSYGELTDLINGRPSDAYDALYKILGLAVLVDVNGRLTAEQKALAAVQKGAKDALATLKSMLADHVDPRAGETEALLRLRAVDLDKLAALATADAAPDDTVVPVLQRLARLPLPDRESLASTVSSLRAAQERIDAAAGTPAAQARALAELLGQALAHHAEHGDGPCPVCGGKVLNSGWAIAAATQRDELTRQAEDLEQAHQTVRSALTALRSALAVTPSELATDVDGIATEAARLAWRRWEDLTRLEAPAADKVLTTFDELTEAVQPVRTGAQERLDQRAQAWHPVAQQVDAFVEAERASRDAAANLTALKAGIDWLKAVDDDIRNDSLAPIARRANEIWQSLRQGSSIQFGGMRLTGVGNRRHLAISVDVDDVGGAALSVMSQGELHSLGLGLFLPRATLPSSPFRFLIIDDPVQAMDPAKVHGLAEVLSELAKTRQVVVFTHDDRLPAAVRQLQLDNARVVTVTRGPRSRVSVGKASKGDPADRYLDDAMAIAKDDKVAPEARLAVTAAMVREAIESVCHDLVRRREYQKGTPAQEVEDSLSHALKLREKLALALLGDARKTSEVGNRLGRVNRDANDIVRQANEGAHGGAFSDPADFVRRAERFVAELRK